MMVIVIIIVGTQSYVHLMTHIICMCDRFIRNGKIEKKSDFKFHRTKMCRKSRVKSDMIQDKSTS